MKQYWARINGKDYPIAFGFTLTDEFSENLDSGAINLPHVGETLSIKPYDDVIIHDFDPSSENPLPPRPIGVVVDTSRYFDADGNDITDQKSATPTFAGHFYRHMVVHEFSRQKVSMDEIEGRIFYNYQIVLKSETSGLETVQLPNKTITQPRGTGEGETTNLSEVDFDYPEGNAYSLPYGAVNSYQDGLIVDRSEQPGSTTTRYLFAGDIDAKTSDYCRFTPMLYGIEEQTRFLLPDWNVSGVTIVAEIGTAFGTRIAYAKTYSPIKHWVVVRNGIEPSYWNSQQNAVARIKAYLEAVENGSPTLSLDFPEIRNATFGMDADEKSEMAISSIYATAPQSYGSYSVYLYVEPTFPEGGTQFNVFGMTDNSHGATVPTEQSEFLARWDFVVVTQGNVGASKGVLSVYEAIRQAVSLYSPYIKVTDDGENWHWMRKYSIHPDTKAKFQAAIAPENQWNYPNLRDFITKLFYVADCIPTVKDNVICHLDLSQRNPMPFDADPNRISFDQVSMDGSSYCDRLLRNYTDGLSKENVVKCVERIGFKNSDAATLTLENLRLELSHPIYRVDKIYMCYYSKFSKNGDDYMRLCKQDITPLVILNAQRNLLSEDWNTLQHVLNTPKNIEELAKFKYATIGYDLGSNVIAGWGAKYNFPRAVFWNANKTVIENIFMYVKTKNVIGSYLPSEELAGYEMEEEFESNADIDREAISYENGTYSDEDVVIYNSSMVGSSLYGELFSNFTQKLKSMVFIIEYEGFVSGAVMASKDFHDGNVVSRDNASSSLSFVESDGTNQKEKVNRLGNATATCTARYKDPADVAALSQVWDDEDHTDEVLFKKTVRYDADYVTASYYFCRDFVIRNYFTSVYSKHRPFPLASYEESVERQENKCLQILLSPDESYWQNESNRLEFDGDYGRLLSFFLPSEYDSAGNLHIEDGIDVAYYKVYPSAVNSYKGQVGAFAVDVQKFISGTSLCFVVSMKDSASGGVFVSDFNHRLSAFIWETITNTFNLMESGHWDLTVDETVASNLLTGAKQDWFMFPVDPDTGMLYNMTFAVGYKKNDVYAINEIKDYKKYDIALSQLLPLMDSVIEKADGSVEYFGELDGQGRAIGGGYPTASLIENGEWYKVEIDHDTIGSVIDDVSGGFVTPDGVALPEREHIGEMACAVFRASEIENSAETKDCVFKDGKERITTTLQFEPISEDNRIMFSEYLFKLSDVMGGKEKNYREIEIRDRIVFKKGVINTYIYSRGSNAPTSGFSIYMGIPTMSICVPRDAVYDIGGQSFQFDEYFNVKSQDGSVTIYGVHMKGMTVSHDFKTIVALCDITFNGTQVLTNQNVVFYDLEELDASITGRTGVSDYKKDVFCMKEDFRYKTYAFVEDYFQFGNLSDNVTVSYNQFETGQEYPFFLGNVYRGTPQIASLYRFFPDLEPIDNFDYWQVFQNDGINYKNVRWIADYWIGTYEIRTIYKNTSSKDIGIKIGEGEYKGVNMVWLFSSQKMDFGTPYETTSRLNGTIMSSDPDSSDTPKFLIGDNLTLAMDSHYRLNMAIRMPFELTGPGSLRLYYLEKGVYRFVFGINMDREGGDSKNCVLPKNGMYKIYVSFLDDRSKTVWDSRSGDPSYEIVNFADDVRYPSNLCVEKGD